jgi:hypothetical protein
MVTARPYHHIVLLSQPKVGHGAPHFALDLG